MPIYKVGKPYNPAKKQWQEGAWYQCRQGEHELLMFMTNISQAERVAVRKGHVEFALLECEPAIFLLYRFGDAIPWSDSPFSIHLVSAPAERIVPTKTDKRMLLNIHLVEASNGLLQGIRVCSLSAEFGDLLAAAIRRQYDAPFDQGAYDHCLSRTYTRFTKPTDMLREAAIVEVGGRV